MRDWNLRFVHSLLLLAGWLVWTVVPARAGVIYDQTFTANVANDPTAGGPVHASAEFVISTSGGTTDLQITLQNLIADQLTVGQSVTGLLFDLGGSNTSGTVTYHSSSGTPRTLETNGTFTDGSLTDTGWRFPPTPSSTESGPSITLDWFNRDKSVAGGQAQYTLIGQPGANGLYNNANTSLMNLAHTPVLAGPLLFNLSLPNGVNSVSNVVFEFGTALGDTQPGSPTGNGHQTPVPAPPALTLALLGGGCLVLFGLRHRSALSGV
jgi:hypothetical protein